MTTKEDLSDTILIIIDTLISVVFDILTTVCELVKEGRDLIELTIILLPVLPILYIVTFHLFNAID